MFLRFCSRYFHIIFSKFVQSQNILHLCEYRFLLKGNFFRRRLLALSYTFKTSQLLIINGDKARVDVHVRCAFFTYQRGLPIGACPLLGSEGPEVWQVCSRISTLLVVICFLWKSGS